jgi:hypothetical protein
MIRLFKDHGRIILAILEWARERHQASPTGVILDQLRAANRRADQEDGSLTRAEQDLSDLYDVMTERERENGGPLDLETEIIAPLRAQINAEEPDDPSLIDRIVEILQLPFGRQILSRRTLDALRGAVLNQAEMTHFEAVTRQREITCFRCDHRFHANEAVTVVQTAGGDFNFYCRKCWTPLYVACAHAECHRMAPADNINQPAFCDRHQEGVANPAAGVVAEVAPNYIPFDAANNGWAAIIDPPPEVGDAPVANPFRDAAIPAQELHNRNPRPNQVVRAVNPRRRWRDR